MTRMVLSGLKIYEFIVVRVKQLPHSSSSFVSNSCLWCHGFCPYSWGWAKFKKFTVEFQSSLLLSTPLFCVYEFVAGLWVFPACSCSSGSCVRGSILSVTQHMEAAVLWQHFLCHTCVAGSSTNYVVDFCGPVKRQKAYCKMVFIITSNFVICRMEQL